MEEEGRKEEDNAILILIYSYVGEGGGEGIVQK